MKRDLRLGINIDHVATIRNARGGGHPDPVHAAKAAEAAGADGILIHSKKTDADEILTFSREWAGRAPLVIVPTMYYATPTDAFRDVGVSLVIWANHNLRAALSAMRDTSRRIMEEQSLESVEGEVASVKEIFHIVGQGELAAAEARYLKPKVGEYKAILLAASRGSALGPLTERMPKCMLDIRGQPLLKRLVSTFNDGGVRDISVVRGYRKDMIDLANVRAIDNNAFATTGEAASLGRMPERRMTCSRKPSRSSPVMPEPMPGGPVHWPTSQSGIPTNLTTTGLMTAPRR